MAADEHIESGVHHHEAGAHEHKAEGGNGLSLLSAAALLGVGAIVESELLAGIALGAGAVLGLRAVSTLSSEVVRPIAKTAIRATYAAAAKATELAAEAGEQVQDLVAEARAEYEAPKPPPPVREM